MDAKHAMPPDRAGPADPPVPPDRIGGAADADPLVPADLRPQPPPSGLHQPIRILVALAEVVLAMVLVVATVWAWRRGSVPYDLPATDNPAVPESVDRWSGPWIGAAFGLAALAGVLLLDAARQLVLAVGGRWQTPAHADDTPADGDDATT